MDKDTLYYDGACPLCSAEISKLEKFSNGKLVLQDIHELGDGEANRNKALLLSRLHLKTADGEWVTGLKANIRAWQHTPFRALWRMLDWPLINRVSHYCHSAANPGPRVIPTVDYASRPREVPTIEFPVPFAAATFWSCHAQSAAVGKPVFCTNVHQPIICPQGALTCKPH